MIEATQAELDAIDREVKERQLIFERGKSTGCEFALLAIKQYPISVAISMIEAMYVK